MKIWTTILACCVALVCLDAARAQDKHEAAVSIQVAGYVSKPKQVRVDVNITIAGFFKLAGANEFSDGRRLVIVRHEWHYAEADAKSETTARELVVNHDAKVSSLGLKNGDVVCFVMRRPVGK